MPLFVPVLLALFVPLPSVAASTEQPSVIAYTSTITQPTTSLVPFYSQFTDISSPTWKKQGCGIASLAMVIGYFKQSPVSVDKLLAEGIAAGAYSNAGWTYKGLIQVAKNHGLQGTAYDLTSSGATTALTQFTHSLKDGPVIASVHYKFDPKSTIPHLVVINKIENGTVYYNDPAAKNGEKQISITTFTKAWKQRYIVIRPQAASNKIALAL